MSWWDHPRQKSVVVGPIMTNAAKGRAPRQAHLAHKSPSVPGALVGRSLMITGTAGGDWGTAGGDYSNSMIHGGGRAAGLSEVARPGVRARAGVAVGERGRRRTRPSAGVTGGGRGRRRVWLVAGVARQARAPGWWRRNMRVTCWRGVSPCGNTS